MLDISNFLFTLLGVPYQQLQQDVLHSVCEDQNYESEKSTSKLNKYIYLNVWGVDEKTSFIETCRKNFLVYMVTIDNYMEEQSYSGSVSPETHKRIMDERVSLMSESKPQLDSLSQKTSSCRTRTSRKISKQKRDSKIIKFIKKLIPSKNNEVDRNKCNSACMEEIFVRNYNYQTDTYKDVRGKNLTPFTAPISIIENPSMNSPTSAEILREINNFTSRIEESENGIKNLIIKHFQDKNIEKELLNAITNHGDMLAEFEKRSISMSNDHWIQEAESFKEQHKNLQATMNTIIHQNRELVEENELISKKYEKLSAAMVVLQEGSSESSTKSPTISSRFILEDLSKNNDRLRHKVNTIMSQVSEMEANVNKYQKRAQFLQQQLNNTKVELYNSKMNHEKNKTDLEMQIVKLNTELQNNADIFKQCTENGSGIMKDLEMLKMQLEPITKVINWDKFQLGNEVSELASLPNLIHLNRLCINELSNELIHKQNEVNRANSEIDSLKQSNNQIEPLKEELQGLQLKLDTSSKTIQEYENELKVLKESISNTEKKIESNTVIVHTKEAELEAKDKVIKERDEEIHFLNETISTAKLEFNQLNFTTDKLRHENNALQMQVKGMAQVLTATGAGDIAKELANAQEKLTAVQTQYFTLVAENNILLKQIETNKSERQTLISYQKSCYEQLQVLHKDIETLEKRNEALMEQLEREKQTVSALQIERVRHLEERTILTAIYERLKSEISKVDQLEGAVTTMNKKASKLAMIAEYNKQLGEKLQMEVAEKDVAINELQNNVNQLNSFQMESTKEKVALCEELNKVFSVKEVLNTKLTAELEKNVILDESKKEIQNSANLQLKEIQAAYNREHAALKNLVQDVKQLVAERDLLIESKKEVEEKCMNLMADQDKLMEYIKGVKEECKNKEDRIVEVEKLLDIRSSDFDAFKKNNDNEIELLRSKFELVSSQTETLNKEKDNLKNSIDYLQTDLNKTRADLDCSRQNEHEALKNLEEMQTKHNSLCEDFQQKMFSVHQIIEENEELKMNVYSLTEKYNCLQQENDRMSKDSVRLETQLAEKFQTHKLSGQPTPKHIENVLDDINARDNEILVLQDHIRDIEERAMELNDLLETISHNRDAFENRSKELEQQLIDVINQFQNAERRIQELESFIQEMQMTRVSVEQLEEQQNQFNMSLEDMKNDYTSQMEDLAADLQKMEMEKQQLLAEVKIAEDKVQQYKVAHEKLQKAHKVLALKLFTAVRVLICEKVNLEKTQNQLKALEQEQKQSLEFKKFKEEEVLSCKQEIEILKSKYQEIKEEKEGILESMSSARSIIHELEARLEENAYHNESTIHLQDAIKEQDSRIRCLKNQLEDCRKNSDELQTIITKLESSCACMEFNKSEAELRLHEMQTKMQNEIKSNEQMKNVIHSALSLIIEMKEKSLITPVVHNAMIQLLQNVHI